MKFKCWSVDDEDESCAEETIAAVPKYAAQNYAEVVYELAAGENCDPMEIHVRDETGTLTRWTVTPVVEVYFGAVESKRVTP